MHLIMYVILKVSVTVQLVILLLDAFSLGELFITAFKTCSNPN